MPMSNSICLNKRAQSKQEMQHKGSCAFGRELRGKVVLLDFWTYCCVNCMHVLPELAALEAKYANQAVVVVGVHSAKFDNEKAGPTFFLLFVMMLQLNLRVSVIQEACCTLACDVNIVS